jgi:hypothetical protein
MYSYIDANNCSNTATQPTMVNALPIVNLGADTTICATDSLMLDAGMFVSYSWTTNETTATIYVDSTNMGIGSFDYSVVVTDINTCMNTDTIMVTYEATPMSMLTDTASICGEDAIIQLDAGSNVSYSYLWTGGANTSTLDVDTALLGSTMDFVYVQISSPAGCTMRDSALVYFREVPMPNLGMDSTICVNHNIMLDAGSYTSYLWSNNATTQTIMLDSLSFTVGTNTIWVEVTNIVNCSNRDTMILTVDPCTGIFTPTLSDADIRIYPNPTKGLFQVDVTGMEDQAYEMGVYNATGSVVFKDQVNYNGQATQSWKLDFSTYPKGVYFIRLQSADRIKVKRVIVQ